MPRSRPLALIALFVLGGCGGSPAPSAVTIGAEGGTVEIDGAVLIVPPGALSEPTEITIAQRALSIPGGVVAYSPVFEFSPDGLTFHLPATVELRFDGDPSRAQVYWSTSGGGHAALESTVSGDRVRAMVTHFSTGFAGAAESSSTTDGGVADEDGGGPPVDGGAEETLGELLWTNPSGTGGVWVVADGTHAYWATPVNHGIFSIEHTSSTPVNIAADVSAKMIALDGEWIYGLGVDSVYRWPTTGGERETVVNRGLVPSHTNALVARGNHLAFSTPDTLLLVVIDSGQRIPLASNAIPVALTDSHLYSVFSRIRKRSLITNEEVELATGRLTSTTNLGVAGGLVYYNDNHMPDETTFSHGIFSIPEAGGSPSLVVETELNPRRMKVDDEHVYWLDSTGVSRAPRTGGTSETIVAIPSTSSGRSPTHLAIGGGYAYWTNTLGEVRRLALP